MLSAGGSGGITGFKYTQLVTSNNSSSPKTYVTSSYGVVVGRRNWDSDTISVLSVDSQHGGTTEMYIGQYERGVIGLFSAGATITVEGYRREAAATAHIFEFI